MGIIRDMVTEPAAWHALSADATLERLRTTPRGLSDAEVKERLARYGPNALSAGKMVSAWEILLDQFRSVVVMLLVATAIVAWLIGDAVEAGAVLGVLVINASIGFITELRARTAMAALLRLEVPTAMVLRGG
ncbi:MAG TPA: cation-transporting P-type ATPase, partial [Longimicrobiales bacterium]|nr:cation-transporting P-type ATPase [Longimicrobiales bacterium]